ncbi:MAG: 16S rRNA (cytidine(1402)-2'-O)-methyltransferase [Candidatus Marinimicrobia bacterium]|jgi:16S rRNA (cytidine1402-2'-O)-methyltransferase|nr:16S rRNA (cytidine(1402)-2'-O)-methyltransferase [Candidatus Neomarinimicrobiota bacterium]MBT4554956.1 16S rRNA (cytidine(1402)-2'-O)-methyltransferase [Candidatus Neomarinimicrobiota bacterium]MBT4753998.1 16S rRNA (cytidine(1402)-2'-O)-methyltransferase [Candidatus Neomarinimicrobiota bacterium]MBT7043219.1 16S rRNA (cytidine(1402)-2'-O)-methyltransferase [Candidatus Neomarinimicrobiota bacterium]MBT7945351.1 16S rRNA (cytidine(1402)-2'-O)-methyltransferase [Candidatus Neomarinimicrobiota|tara:strand:- start:2734 stop:3432 length:699 start_codon:yes stop_codon:yes gene_type:complete
MTEIAGKVYIVSTPIGNLGDMTYRAVETLKAVPMIAAEDTRHSRKLLDHYNISTPMISYYEHNRFTRIPKIIDHLNSGKDIAVITDAGTPGISDPAYKLIREALLHNIIIESIPGASASLAALVSSGLPTDRFLFEGFLPPKKGRKGRIARVENEQATLIYYESPKRLLRTLRQLLEGLGDRPAVVARELTKLYEEIKRGKLSDLLTYYTNKTPKGECVILVGKDDPNVYFE